MMKQFNVIAQVFDMCGSNPGKKVLYSEIVRSKNEDQARKRFEFQLLIDDIITHEIVSVEKVSQPII